MSEDLDRTQPAGKPRVEVQQAGRWTYRLVLRSADTFWLDMDCGTVLGRRRAHRVARRILNQHLRSENPTVVGVVTS